MDESEVLIRCACGLFACRLCRTKTGWPHQRWCARRELAEPECPDCRYYEAEQGLCAHPSRKAVLQKCVGRSCVLNATQASITSRS